MQSVPQPVSLSHPDQFRKACQRLDKLVPRRLRRTVEWLHRKNARPVRLPLAVLCLIGGCFSFLPVLGVELFPIGLLLLAHDVPSLRRPAGRMTLWILDCSERSWRCCKQWRDDWRAGKSRQPVGRTVATSAANRAHRRG